MGLKGICLFMLFVTANLFAQEAKTAKVIGGPDAHKIGETYHILQYRANVRVEPSVNSNIIAVLGLNDKVEILEYSDIQEVINEINGVWLKIKHKNIVGYMFSGSIAMGSLITKLAIIDSEDYYKIIDEVNVSLHFRRSEFYEDRIFWGWDHDRDNLSNELFFYINNQRINTNSINIVPGPLDRIEFEQGRTAVLIYLIAYAREGTRRYIYKLNNNGVIEFIGEYGLWYPDWYLRD